VDLKQNSISKEVTKIEILVNEEGVEGNVLNQSWGYEAIN
jgi:hypothetical protein